MFANLHVHVQCAWVPDLKDYDDGGGGDDDDDDDHDHHRKLTADSRVWRPSGGVPRQPVLEATHSPTAKSVGKP